MLIQGITWDEESEYTNLVSRCIHNQHRIKNWRVLDLHAINTVDTTMIGKCEWAREVKSWNKRPNQHNTSWTPHRSHDIMTAFYSVGDDQFGLFFLFRWKDTDRFRAYLPSNRCITSTHGLQDVAGCHSRSSHTHHTATPPTETWPCFQSFSSLEQVESFQRNFNWILVECKRLSEFSLTITIDGQTEASEVSVCVTIDPCITNLLST